MDICHIVNGSNYTIMKTYIRFVNEYFHDNKHHFFISDLQKNIPKSMIEQHNVSALISKSRVKRFKIMENLIRSNDLIILHSLSLPIDLQLYLLVRPSLMEKVIWVSWGMDLYQWRRKSINLIKILKNQVAYLFRLSIKRFVGIFPPDIDYFKMQFKTEAKTFYASYPDCLYNPIFNNEIDQLEHYDSTEQLKRIMVGHQCNPVLNHFDVLDILRKFKDENMQIIIPLSYGDMKYGDNVEEYATTLFGEKVMCIRNKMDKENYMNLLNTIDVAIFNTNRQIGLGNIYPLIHLGKKLIMPADSVMYKYFTNESIEIFDYNKINDCDFECLFQKIELIKGKKFIRDKILNKDLYFKMWDNVFKSNTIIQGDQL